MFCGVFYNFVSFPAAGEHLNRVVELWRLHLFSIVTQYRAVFGDSEQDLAATQGSSQSTVFYTWLMEKVSRLKNACIDEIMGRYLFWPSQSMRL